MVDIYAEKNHAGKFDVIKPPAILQRKSEMTSTPPPRPPVKRENLLLNLAFNILIPSLILAKLSTPDRLGPVVSLVAALAFPLSYGLFDFWKRRTANFVSVIGFISVLLTGGLGLMQMEGVWFAVKEASVPSVIGFAVWASMRSKRPLVRQFLYNEQVINVPKVHDALVERNAVPAFDRLLATASYWLVASFLFSAVLNFALARWLLQSPPGTPEFNAELAKMNLLSWPVIALPSTAIMMFALWKLLGGITRLTGMPLEEIFHPQPEKKR
jgi:hypothetical protein